LFEKGKQADLALYLLPEANDAPAVAGHAVHSGPGERAHEGRCSILNGVGQPISDDILNLMPRCSSK
jgi:hypothetical protein